MQALSWNSRRMVGNHTEMEIIMTLQEYQDELYEILCVVDDVCRKNNITYALHGGTMLGAVRHHDFIPWDNDIDILVMWKDYDRLCERLREELPEYMQVMEPDDLIPNFYDYVTRVSDTRYFLREPDEESLFYDNKQNYARIDIFPFAYSANTAFGVSCLVLCHKILYGLGMGHRYCIKDKNYTTMQKIQTRVLGWIGSKITMKRIMKWKKKLIDMQDRKKRKYCMSVYTTIKGVAKRFESQWYEGVTMMPFRDRKLPVPVGYDGHLTLQYGDYRTPARKGVQRAYGIKRKTDEKGMPI